MFKELRNKKRQKQNSFQFNFGEQDQVDLISYSGLEENPNYLQMGDKFMRTLFISGYPYVASTGWLTLTIILIFPITLNKSTP